MIATTVPFVSFVHFFSRQLLCNHVLQIKQLTRMYRIDELGDVERFIKREDIVLKVYPKRRPKLFRSYIVKNLCKMRENPTRFADNYQVAPQILPVVVMWSKCSSARHDCVISNSRGNY